MQRIQIDQIAIDTPSVENYMDPNDFVEVIHTNILYWREYEVEINVPGEQLKARFPKVGCTQPVLVRCRSQKNPHLSYRYRL